MSRSALAVLVALVVVAVVLVAWAVVSAAREPFSTFSGPTNPLINVYAARPEFDPRFNLLWPAAANRGDFSQAALVAEAKRRGRGGPYAEFGGMYPSCAWDVCGPAPCRATERLTGIPGHKSAPASGAERLTGVRIRCQGPWYARATGGETGSPWLGSPGVGAAIGPWTREGFKPTRAPSVPRADGGRKLNPFEGATDAAVSKFADLARLGERPLGFTQLTRGSLARYQSANAPNELTGVGQGLRGDPRINPPAGTTQGIFRDTLPAHGAHAAGVMGPASVASSRFLW